MRTQVRLDYEDALALDDLRFNWGDVYDITTDGYRWVAQAPGPNVALIAHDAEVLRDMIRADYNRRTAR